MRLLSVDISGFKSFARRIHIDFKPGITGIIGPNGSGKSNVAEAIKWALGEQSSKALRAKERSDVIYSGSGEKAPRAVVTLTFDNENGRFPVGASEIAITRSLSRGGESQYLINNETVRLVDLHQMLAEAGVGTKSYTVISQGTVDRYLTATPAGRRELFDEATGVKSLQIKMTQAEQKLAKTKAHAEEIQTVLEELTPRVSFLKRQLDRYAMREKYEQEFRAKQQSWYHHTWHQLATSLEHLQSEHAEVTSRIEQARSARIALEKKISQEVQEIHEQDLIRAAYDRWKKEYDEAAAALESVSQSRKHADSLAGAAPAKSPWADRARSVLSECKVLVESLLHGTAPSSKSISSIHTELSKLLNDQETSLASSTPDMRQEASRLAAVEQEKRAQLEKLKHNEPPKPTKTLITSEQRNRASALEQTRTKEIREEKEESALLSALEQARREYSLLEQEILRECGSKVLETCKRSLPTEEAPSDEELRRLSDKISAIGQRDSLVEKEYEEAHARHESFATQLADVRATITRIEDGIEQVSKEIQENFQTQFAVIQKSFAGYFTQLFGGGTAELSVQEDGIDIVVAPPKKRARALTLLSGGEKALTSLALLLAILDAQEPPFIVLDEVDAALDEANSKRFASLLQSRRHTTQSIVISHNRETMAVSDILYGVTMRQDGTSHVYSVALQEAAS